MKADQVKYVRLRYESEKLDKSDVRYRRKPGPMRKPIENEELEEKLKTKNFLTEWAPFSLKRRCQILQ